MAKTKIWLIIAIILVLIGCVVFAGVMTALDWNFFNLSTVKFETNGYDIDEPFQSISIQSDTADIIFKPAPGEVPSVVFFEEANAKHIVSVKDGTLIIERNHAVKWHDRIGINLHDPDIKVFLPQQQYDTLTITESTGDIEIPKEFTFDTIDISLSTGDVRNYTSASSIKIKTTTGDIYTENISAENLSLSVTTGKVTARSVACKGELNIAVTTGDATLTDVVCNELNTAGNTGDITLENVTAAENVSIVRSTGDVKFQNCDAGALTIETDTGDVTGNLLSEKIFITETSTGTVDIPRSTTGGICQISTSTGDIKITIG